MESFDLSGDEVGAQRASTRKQVVAYRAGFVWLGLADQDGYQYELGEGPATSSLTRP